MKLPGIVAITAVVCGCGPATYPASIAHPLLGQPLPAIHHRHTLDGQPLEAEQLAGKPVLVKFFAQYCQPCRATLPAAERLHETHPGVVFLGIDEDESIDTADAIAKQYGLSFAVVHDEGNVLSGRFRVSTMPTTFVADSKGVVRWVGGEEQTEDELRRAVDAAR